MWLSGLKRWLAKLLNLINFASSNLVIYFILMYLSILVFPFLSFFSTNLLGRFIGIKGSCILATFSIAFSFVLAIFIFYESALCGSVCTVLLST